MAEWSPQFVLDPVAVIPVQELLEREGGDEPDDDAAAHAEDVVECVDALEAHVEHFASRSEPAARPTVRSGIRSSVRWGSRTVMAPASAMTLIATPASVTQMSVLIGRMNGRANRSRR